jgi:hypothetical protein
VADKTLLHRLVGGKHRGAVRLELAEAPSIPALDFGYFGAFCVLRPTATSESVFARTPTERLMVQTSEGAAGRRRCPPPSVHMMAPGGRSAPTSDRKAPPLFGNDGAFPCACAASQR